LLLALLRALMRVLPVLQLALQPAVLVLLA
jgi:hypothetical protein